MEIKWAAYGKICRWRWTGHNWVWAIGNTSGLVPSRSYPSAERLTWPELRALSSLPFSTAAGTGGTRGQGGRQSFWLARMKRVCVCVCVGEVREVPLACVLWAFSCFLLWSSPSSFHPTRSLCLRPLVCSTPMAGLGRNLGGGWLPLTETLLVLSILEEMRGELPMGAQPPGTEASGRRDHQELKWCTLYTSLLLFYTLLDPPTVGWNSCMKNNCHSARGWPPDPSRHGKVHPSAGSYIKPAKVMTIPK